MSRSRIWGVIIIFGVASAFLSALIFGLLVATILTLIITPVLLAAPAVFHQAGVARRERRIIAKMVEAASTGKGGPDNLMTHAAAE